MAATLAALPPEEPPGTLDKSSGFLVGPKKDVSLNSPMANSSKFAFPIIIPSSALIFSTTVASKGAIKFSSILDPAVVLKSFVLILSLTDIGIPAKIPSFSLFFNFISISCACFRALSVS